MQLCARRGVRKVIGGLTCSVSRGGGRRLVRNLIRHHMTPQNVVHMQVTRKRGLPNRLPRNGVDRKCIQDSRRRFHSLCPRRARRRRASRTFFKYFSATRGYGGVDEGGSASRDVQTKGVLRRGGVHNRVPNCGWKRWRSSLSDSKVLRYRFSKVVS